MDDEDFEKLLGEGIVVAQGDAEATRLILFELCVLLLRPHPDGRGIARRMFEAVSARIDHLPDELGQKLATGEARAVASAFFSQLERHLLAAPPPSPEGEPPPRG